MQVLSIKKLNGYDDQNFHVKVNLTEYNNSNITSICQSGYVVKVMNSHDSVKNKDHVGKLTKSSVQIMQYYQI